MERNEQKNVTDQQGTSYSEKDKQQEAASDEETDDAEEQILEELHKIKVKILDEYNETQSEYTSLKQHIKDTKPKYDPDTIVALKMNSKIMEKKFKIIQKFIKDLRNCTPM